MGKRSSVILVLFSLSSALSAGAEPVCVSSQAVIGNEVGEVQITFSGTNDGVLSGEIEVKKLSDAVIMQRFTVENIYHPLDAPLSFEFTDLNDDGFKDVIFWNSRTGDAGAAETGDVFMWVPKLRNFVLSQK